MANTKISALTAATTPVAGTEVLPIVQSSATVKLAISDLTPGLSTITAAKGGTGQTSYAVGDLLYASATTTLSKLADVATGNALISGGVGVAPSYGKIGLTTHVSGTLPVANGGTNLTSFTANGIVYASSTSALATGSALTFDGTNFSTTGSVTSAGTSNSSNQTFTGTGNKIIGDFSSTPTSRVAFQTSTVNGNTNLEVIPNGSATSTALNLESDPALTNGTFFQLGLNGGTDARLTSAIRGTGTYLPMTWYTGGSERIRLDTSGNWMLNSTTASGKFTVQCANGATAIVTGNASGTAAYNAALFYNNGLTSLVGQISVSGSTTTYLSISDYRLKDSIKPMTGAITKVQALKPVTYKWKSSGADGEGFIAHELAEVCPYAVGGEKDAVDDNGNPQYQGIDTSFLVATLTAAIQEQQILIEQLTNRIAALEAK